MATNTLKMKAYAKVNLALDVLRRKPDGYHEVKMVMQNLDIYDELEFTVVERISKETEISLTTNKEGIPTDDRNLICKAIRLLFEEYNITSKIKINLIKNIPAEAGMAGGSTDCAAALKAVNTLYELGLNEETLMKQGVKLGADVPYCVMARTALSEGIGEVLTPVTGLSDCLVLVAKPPVNVSTKMVYTNLKLDEVTKHPNVDGMVNALETKDLFAVAKHMENLLETVTVKLHPEIEELKNIMKKMGALNAIMSGSGPTVFGIFTDETKIKEAAKYIKDSGLSKEVFVTGPM